MHDCSAENEQQFCVCFWVCCFPSSITLFLCLLTLSELPSCLLQHQILSLGSMITLNSAALVPIVAGVLATALLPQILSLSSIPGSSSVNAPTSHWSRDSSLTLSMSSISLGANERASWGFESNNLKSQLCLLVPILEPNSPTAPGPGTTMIFYCNSDARRCISCFSM